MKKIPITNEKYAIVDDVDFHYLKQFSWYLSSDYATRKVMGKALKMHREIMQAKPDQLVDHVNRNRLDNRRSNLRFCTRSQNAMNKKRTIKNSTGLKGVTFDVSARKINYYAKIKKGPWTLKWGPFWTAEMAHEKYKYLSKIVHGEYGRTE